MLESMLYGYHYGVFADNAYRCCRCGSGQVTATDGLMMSHCMKCGNWQGGYESVNLRAGRIKDGLVGLMKKTMTATLKLFSFKSKDSQQAALSS